MDSIDLRPEELWDDNSENEDDLERELHRLEREEADDEDRGGRATEPGEGEPEAIDVDALSSLQKLRTAENDATKKRVLRPRPKLDSIRLMGARGLEALMETMQHQKWRGKGHERKDLAKLMSLYEHWGHRMLPLMRFDDIIEKLEDLGHKKVVKAIMTKIRMGAPLAAGGTGEDYPVQNKDDSDHERENVPGALSYGINDTWEAAVATPEVSQPTVATSEVSQPTVASPEASQPTVASPEVSQRTFQSSATAGPSSASPLLSQEVQDRIAANRERALALRRQRLSQLASASPQV